MAVDIKASLARIVKFLANMGLTISGDPPRKIEVEGREWGETVDGLRLSIRELPRIAGQNPEVSVIMQNTGTKTWKLRIPDWIFFHEVETTAPLTEFGERLFGPQGRREFHEITVGPGDATEADVPVGSYYSMQAGETYPVRVFSKIPGGPVIYSNRISFRV